MSILYFRDLYNSVFIFYYLDFRVVEVIINYYVCFGFIDLIDFYYWKNMIFLFLDRILLI